MSIVSGGRWAVPPSRPPPRPRNPRLVLAPLLRRRPPSAPQPPPPRGTPRLRWKPPRPRRPPRRPPHRPSRQRRSHRSPHPSRPSRPPSRQPDLPRRPQPPPPRSRRLARTRPHRRPPRPRRLRLPGRVVSPRPPGSAAAADRCRGIRLIGAEPRAATRSPRLNPGLPCPGRGRRRRPGPSSAPIRRLPRPSSPATTSRRPGSGRTIIGKLAGRTTRGRGPAMGPGVRPSPAARRGARSRRSPPSNPNRARPRPGGPTAPVPADPGPAALREFRTPRPSVPSVGSRPKRCGG